MVSLGSMGQQRSKSGKPKGLQTKSVRGGGVPKRGEIPKEIQRARLNFGRASKQGPHQAE